MSFTRDVVAGCAPGTNECAVQADLPGLDTWFVLVLIVPLILAIVAGAFLVARRGIRRGAEAATRTADLEARPEALL